MVFHVAGLEHNGTQGMEGHDVHSSAGDAFGNVHTPGFGHSALGHAQASYEGHVSHEGHGLLSGASDSLHGMASSTAQAAHGIVHTAQGAASSVAHGVQDTAAGIGHGASGAIHGTLQTPGQGVASAGHGTSNGHMPIR